MSAYIGMISSDWSQCLSPSGPFDAFVFHYPLIEGDLLHIFKSYTANKISLSQAVARLNAIVPATLTIEQMDDYLEARFDVYEGVAELISWCRRHRILFMINTTGFMGYFQRILARALLPPFTALSAQSMLRFKSGTDDPEQMIDLVEIEDKASNTDTVARRFQISPEKIIIIGDSGGDGPHFKWGAEIGATLIASMAKPSLSKFCRDNGLLIHHHIGHTYAEGEKVCPQKEKDIDYRELKNVVRQTLDIL